MPNDTNDGDIHLPDLPDQAPPSPDNMPPNPVSTGTRRARVEDDDEDMAHGQRERNRPRIQSPTRSQPSPLADEQPSTAESRQPATGPNPAAVAHHFTVPRTAMQFTISTNQQEPFAQVNVFFDSSLPPPNGVNLTDHGETEFAFDNGPVSREGLMRTFGQLLASLPVGVDSLDRSPDIARAKTIINALERIPRGLIQRMDAVGGVMGTASDNSSEQDVATCAVCWEALLHEGSFAPDTAEANNDPPVPVAEPESSSEIVAFTEEERDALATEVLALPCRHLFHGSCLVPWLSRQTTCPSCRFNLDPESLTSHQRRGVPWMPMMMNPTENEEILRQDPPFPIPIPTSGTIPPVNLGGTAPTTADQRPQPGNDGPVHQIAMIVVDIGSEVPFPPSQTPAEGTATPNGTAPGLNGSPNTNINERLQAMPPELRSFVTSLFQSNVAADAPGPPPQVNAAATPAIPPITATNMLPPGSPNNVGAGSTTPAATATRPRAPRANVPLHNAASAAGAFVRSLVAAITNPVRRPVNGVGVMPTRTPPPLRTPAPTTTQATTMNLPHVFPMPIPPQSHHANIGVPNPNNFATSSRVLNGTTPLTQVPHIPVAGSPFFDGQMMFGGAADLRTLGILPRPATAPPSTPSTSRGTSVNDPLMRNLFGGRPIPLGAGGTTAPTPTPAASPANAGLPTGSNSSLPGMSFPGFPFFPGFAAPQATAAPSLAESAVGLGSANLPEVTDGSAIPTPNDNTNPNDRAPPIRGTLPPNLFPFPWQSLFPAGSTVQPTERKKWTIPDGRGASIRQRVEHKERDVGLRCYDPSCGLAPSDDVPLGHEKDAKRVLILKDDESRSQICEHSFHAGCLVSAARVAGFHPQADEPDRDVGLPCVVCRSHGHIARGSWNDGVRQLEIGT